VAARTATVTKPLATDVAVPCDRRREPAETEPAAPRGPELVLSAAQRVARDAALERLRSARPTRSVWRPSTEAVEVDLGVLRRRPGMPSLASCCAGSSRAWCELSLARSAITDDGVAAWRASASCGACGSSTPRSATPRSRISRV
jgi:hypothetical protein